MLARGPERLAEVRIEVPASQACLESVHAALETFWAEVERRLPDPPDARWRHCFTLAVVEIASNIVLYAYPTQTGSLRVLLASYGDRVRACVTDSGVACDMLVESAAMPSAADLAEGGYGLALARACLDHLAYERTADGRNRWRLEKRLPSSTAPA